MSSEDSSKTMNRGHSTLLPLVYMVVLALVVWGVLVVIGLV